MQYILHVNAFSIAAPYSFINHDTITFHNQKIEGYIDQDWLNERTVWNWSKLLQHVEPVNFPWNRCLHVILQLYYVLDLNHIQVHKYWRFLIRSWSGFVSWIPTYDTTGMIGASFMAPHDRFILGIFPGILYLLPYNTAWPYCILGMRTLHYLDWHTLLTL